MQDNIKEQLQQLIQVYGAEKVLHNAQCLLGGTNKEPQVAEVTHTLELSTGVEELRKLVGTFDSAAWNILENFSGSVSRLEKIQASKSKGVPAEYFKIIGPEGLDYTFSMLDSALTSQLEAGGKREAAHRDRSDLVRRRAWLETSIKLTEADAIMSIVGTGKDAYVMIGDKMTYMPNDTARDAYRRTVSKEDRKTLALVNGEIAAIEADIVRAKDGWDTAKEASDTLRARANAQSALLNFLASRG
ncbi:MULTISPECIES: hypothetical protein [Pelosinus]|uniref:Uncharacterized protein n=1 Tax=Pelosinus fermentans B4 TaxID=1149862 RepID=I9B495_9FIRM|nr:MULTISPECIES: hypothetical protein [Pelosinus]EIW19952.1 hypothetical protein FB4_0203 [Pelosinus fermentans B4]EIW21191.1 hypothetical protein FA11_0918 [Pelosinus fermentans A11]